MAVFDRGTDYDFFLHERYANVQRSSFNLSALRYATFDMGMIVPIDCFRTNPGEHHKLSYDFLLETLPLAVQPLNRYRLFVQYFYCKNSDLWKGWKTMITRGRNGNIDKIVPRVDLSKPVHTSDGDRYYNGVHSLANYFGIPAFGVHKTVSDTAGNLVSGAFTQYLESQVDDDKTLLTGYNLYKRPSALPFVMYQKIAKFYSYPSNLLQDNPNYYPEQGDDDWMLGYSDASADDNILYNADVALADSSAVFNEVPTNDEHDYCNLLQGRYRQWRGDSFTTALPWLQRGTAPTLESAFDSEFVISSPKIALAGENVEPIFQNITYGDLVTSSDIVDGFPAGFLTYKNPAYESGAGHVTHLSGQASSNLGISANQFRSLLALTVWQERNARTDGSYNKMVEVHFRQNPHSEEHVPIYIGGSSHDIYFREVVQNTPTQDSPAGTKSSVGQSVAGNFVSDFYSDDYGYIMVCVSVAPDVVYQQGVNRDLTATSFSDFYFPEFANLQAEPITNKEIFVSDDDIVNEDLFGYQERDWEYKVRSNHAAGMLSLPPNTDKLFSAYTQARHFTELPNLSNDFATMSPKNVRRDIMAYPSQPMFMFTFASRDNAIRPLPYDSTPETFGF